MADEDAVFTGRFGENAAVPKLGFHIADNGTFGHVAHGEDVPYNELRLSAAVKELTGVRSFRRDEQLLLVLEALGVAESHLLSFFGDDEMGGATVSRLKHIHQREDRTETCVNAAARGGDHHHVVAAMSRDGNGVECAFPQRAIFPASTAAKLVFLGLRATIATDGCVTYLGEGSTTSGIVDDVSDNTFDVTMTLGVVLRREGGVGGSGTAFQMTGNECRVREKKTRVARRCVLDVALGEVHRRQEIPRIDALHMC